jgi:hypothetical protein
MIAGRTSFDKQAWRAWGIAADSFRTMTGR